MIVDIACDGVFGCLIEYERRDGEHRRGALFIAREPDGISESILVQLLDGLVAVSGVWVNLKKWPEGLDLRLFNHSRTSTEAFACDICAAMRQSDLGATIGYD